MSRPKIALFLPLPEHGHVLPTFKLAARLAADGWKPFYLATEPFWPLAQARGFSVIPMLQEKEILAANGGEPFVKAGQSPAERDAGLRKAQAATYRIACEMLEKLKPAAAFVDLFLSDFSLTALQTGTPVAVYHTCLDAEAFRAPPLVRSYGAGNGPLAALRRRLDWLYLWRIRCARRLRKEHGTRIRTESAERAYRERGIALRPSSMCLFGGDINTFVLGPAALSLGNLPADRYFGCGVAEAPEPDAPLAEFDRARPTVYCSFGSMSARYPAALPILRALIEVFRKEGRLNLIAQAGASYDALAGESGGNIRVERFSPQAARLKRVDAVITHGGFGTIKECVAAGLLMLVAPFYQDQFGGARRVAELGIGEALDPKTFDAARAHGIVARLAADPEPRRRLAQLYSPERDAEEFERAYASLLARLGQAPAGAGSLASAR